MALNYPKQLIETKKKTKNTLVYLRTGGNEKKEARRRRPTDEI